MGQLMRITDGAIFDVVGVGTGVWLRKVGGQSYPFSREYVQERFTAYPPQERPVPTGQLMRVLDGKVVVFDVVGVARNMVQLVRADGNGKPFSLSRMHVRTFYAAYPPQRLPDDDIEPMRAVRVTFCPYDMAQTDEDQVTESYAGARVVAHVCPDCGRAFDLKTLAEIKLWKD